ncbi:MAG: hypothetical protein LBR77_08300 [Lachnospiraceae bacterium]|nr:hypothetical protein [Lachnospiraceae bacterium]
MKKTEIVRILAFTVAAAGISTATHVLISNVILGERGKPGFVTPVLMGVYFATMALFASAYLLMAGYMPIRRKLPRGLAFMALAFLSAWLPQVLGLAGGDGEIISQAFSWKILASDCVVYFLAGLVMGPILGGGPTYPRYGILPGNVSAKGAIPGDGAAPTHISPATETIPATDAAVVGCTTQACPDADREAISQAGWAHSGQTVSSPRAAGTFSIAVSACASALLFPLLTMAGDGLMKAACPAFSARVALGVSEGRADMFHLVFFGCFVLTGALLPIFYRFTMYNATHIPSRTWKFALVYTFLLWTPVVMFMVAFGVDVLANVAYALMFVVITMAATLAAGGMMERMNP